MKVRALLTCVMFVSLALTVQTARAAPFYSVEQITAQVEFMFVSESAVFDPATQEVVFTIEFNQPPDFFTVDSFGAQANSFQYFIVGDPTLSWPEKFDAIIRGEEIHVTSDKISIRNVAPSDPDPAAAGWGTIRGVVPYLINGNVLTFSAPLQVISDHSQDGNFAYEIESYQYGTLTNHVDSHSVVPSLVAQLDIKPGNFSNSINPQSRGVIPVALLTTPALDAITVDPLSVAFGPSGAHKTERGSHIEDVDRDGDADLVLHFLTQDTGITCAMEAVSITGQTFNGQTITGTDSIKTVACEKP